VSDIARSEGWKINAVRGNVGRLSGGDVIKFDGTGRVRVDRSGSDWNDVSWVGSDGVASGRLPDDRPFTVTLADAPPAAPQLVCRIGRNGMERDLDGESGGWTAQEGESPVGGPGLEGRRWRWPWNKKKHRQPQQQL
jgi:hypothetical protein